MKGLHIVLLAEGKEMIRHIRLSRKTSLALFVLAVAFVVACSVFARSYMKMKKEVARAQNAEQLARLAEKTEQTDLLLSLALRLKDIKEGIGRLSELEEIALAMMKGKRIQTDTEASQDALGGSDSSPIDLELIASANKEELLKKINLSLEEMEQKVAKLEDSKREFKKYLESQSIRLASIPSIWPVSGSISSPYGKRSSPFEDNSEFHRGVDIRAPYGMPVKASAEGIVKTVGYQAAYGRFVELDHKNGFVTKYAHLSKVLVRPGMKINRGQVIGQVGTTGNSTGPHLHYEVIFKGAPVNPKPYLGGAISLLVTNR